MRYKKKMDDPRWIGKRRRVIERDGYNCQSCGLNERRNNVTLQVHHKTYIDGREPWDYPDELLVTLCDACHRVEHEPAEAVRRAFEELAAVMPSHLRVEAVHLVCDLREIVAARGQHGVNAIESLRRLCQK